MKKRLAYDEIDPKDRFYLHANSISAIQGAFRIGPTKDLPCAEAVDSIIHHLQCEIYILMDEIERLKKED